MIRLLASHTLDAWALLRTALEVEELPPMERSPRGKPRFLTMPDLHFSLSHSGPYALCGLGDVELGVDIETLRPRRDLLPRGVLGPEEFQWFLSRGACWGDFYTLWTLKEAKVKWAGTGIDRPPKDIAVPLLELGQTAELEGLRFTAYGGENWRGALCARQETATLVWN